MREGVLGPGVLGCRLVGWEGALTSFDPGVRTEALSGLLALCRAEPDADFIRFLL